jgi:O-acetyl-ADP-ribose deacetylase (regulator of RNase III)
VKHRIGNIADLQVGVIIHQVNCQGVMGSGVAAALRARYPVIWERYKQRCDDNIDSGAQTAALLGHAQLVQVTDGLWVCNLFSQNNYGRDGRRYTSYDALDTGLKHLWDQLKPLHGALHHPLIGSGLGGGDWNVVKAIIEHRLGHETTLWTLT